MTPELALIVVGIFTGIPFLTFMLISCIDSDGGA